MDQRYNTKAAVVIVELLKCLSSYFIYAGINGGSTKELLNSFQGQETAALSVPSALYVNM